MAQLVCRFALNRSVLFRCRPAYSLREFISTTTLCATNVRQGDGTSEKLYELRTYQIKPERFGELYKLLQEGYQFRTAHSKLIGFWNTELGGLNEMVHMWEYDSYAHRTAVRKALSQDKEWVGKWLSKILTMCDSQTNVILKPFPWWNPQLESSGSNTGVFELVDYRVKPGMIPQFEHRLLQDFPELNYNPLGMWYTVFGDVNRVYSLLRYDTLDQREEMLAEANSSDVVRETVRDLEKFLDGTVKKALIPATYSPLQ